MSERSSAALNDAIGYSSSRETADRIEYFDDSNFDMFKRTSLWRKELDM